MSATRNAGAKRRLAEEYDAAQERGEVKANGGDRTLPQEKSAPSAADIGLTHKDIHERLARSAEVAEPGARIGVKPRSAGRRNVTDGDSPNSSR
jgi:hypothetical protein